MNTYIVVTTTFKNQHEGTQNGPNVLHFVKTKDNKWVTSINAREEFPDIFSGEIRIIDLSVDDFPIKELA